MKCSIKLMYNELTKSFRLSVMFDQFLSPRSHKYYLWLKVRDYGFHTMDWALKTATRNAYILLHTLCK